ncbi:hypothetical protein [Isoptericola cucumis]|uniref:MYXO-CTERM domain-containing protein n=1 Tax=Isoptericola cucumis TaxID=1776856 RepID=A0ABQ2BDR2_9MICO|nr:hypothetical protein [Isoptericola cucumis]GGI11829.1 hypothetical protein GCM10007368_38140 [Isoptericola cucumis]
MVATTRHPIVTTAVRCVLGIVLLTLACVLGLTVVDSPPSGTASASGSVDAVATLADGPNLEAPVAAGGEEVAPGAPAGHHDDGTFALLCLCAMLVATALVTAHRRPVRRAAIMAVRGGEDLPRGPVMALPARPDPLTWGVSRT